MLRTDALEKFSAKETIWTNPSVLALAAGSDPLQAVASKARQIVLEGGARATRARRSDVVGYPKSELLTYTILCVRLYTWRLIWPWMTS
jgi:hypothetical protein